MIRKIITIDQEKCNGCGQCVNTCHEGAIAMEHGKAKLLRDDYCDGLGDCLPACPAGAITFEEREAAPYDEAAVKERMKEREKTFPLLAHGCPGSNARVLSIKESSGMECPPGTAGAPMSRLRQWPVQIKLVPVNAPYFDGAKLLIAADCTAYACGNFHDRFMRNKITLIGCPKLDNENYSEKLGAIIKNNNIQSVTLARMEVPCCGGLEQALEKALLHSGKMIPWQIFVISADGTIKEE